jgi:hypothetical protein
MSTYKDYFNKIWYDPKHPVGFTGLKASRRLSFHISKIAFPDVDLLEEDLY